MARFEPWTCGLKEDLDLHSRPRDYLDPDTQNLCGHMSLRKLKTKLHLHPF